MENRRHGDQKKKFVRLEGTDSTENAHRGWPITLSLPLTPLSAICISLSLHLTLIFDISHLFIPTLDADIQTSLGEIGVEGIWRATRLRQQSAGHVIATDDVHAEHAEHALPANTIATNATDTAGTVRKPDAREQQMQVLRAQA